jgi:hypothetical protein
MKSTATRSSVLVLHPDIKEHDKFGGNIFCAKRFATVVAALRKSYSGFIDEINKVNGQAIDWWVSGPASRNTFQSDSFLNLAYFEYAKEVLEDKQLGLIVCESLGLKECLKKHLEPRDIKIVCVPRRVSHRGVTGLIFLNIFRSIRFLFKESAVLFWSKLQKSRFDPLEKELKLVDVFVGEASFVGGQFVDRFYGELMKQKDQQSWYYLPTFFGTKSKTRVLKLMSQQQFRFLNPYLHLNFRDILWAATHGLRAKKLLKHLPKWGGFDVSPIVLEDLSRNLTATSLDSLLKYCLPFRLKEKNCNVSTIFDWFENQNVDKAQNLGFHECFPRVKIIGYQGYLIHENCLSLFPTLEERKQMVLPDVICVMGVAQKSLVNQFDNGLKMQLAPSFRYPKIFLETPQGNASCLLVILPMLERDREELVSTLNSCLKILGPKAPRVVVKVHPATSAVAIEKLKRHLSRAEIIQEVRLEDLFGQAKMVLSSSSGGSMEAISRGIPCLILSSQTQLSFHPVPSSIDPKIWRLCYSAEDIAMGIRQFESLGDFERQELQVIGRGVLKDFFQPANEVTLADFSNRLSHF